MKDLLAANSFLGLDPRDVNLDRDQEYLLRFADNNPTPRPKADRDGRSRYRLPPPDGGKVRSWTRCTTMAKAIADEYALGLWKERMIAVGLSKRPDLTERVNQVVARDPGFDAQSSKTDVAVIVDLASKAAGASHAASLGTAMHTLTEHHDLGTGLVFPPPWDLEVTAYANALDRLGLIRPAEWVERIVVNPDVDVAGTFDRICDMGTEARLLWNADPSRRHWLLPRVGDLKTGKDLSYSWVEIAIQLSIYAHATHMWAWGVYEPMPAVDLESALVFHLPVGKQTCTVYEVDIAKGWEMAQFCRVVKDWRRRKDLATALVVAQPGSVLALGGVPAEEAFDIEAAVEEAIGGDQAGDAVEVAFPELDEISPTGVPWSEVGLLDPPRRQVSDITWGDGHTVTPPRADALIAMEFDAMGNLAPPSPRIAPKGTGAAINEARWKGLPEPGDAVASDLLDAAGAARRIATATPCSQGHWCCQSHGDHVHMIPPDECLPCSVAKHPASQRITAPSELTGMEKLAAAVEAVEAQNAAEREHLAAQYSDDGEAQNVDPVTGEIECEHYRENIGDEGYICGRCEEEWPCAGYLASHPVEEPPMWPVQPESHRAEMRVAGERVFQQAEGAGQDAATPASAPVAALPAPGPTDTPDPLARSAWVWDRLQAIAVSQLAQQVVIRDWPVGVPAHGPWSDEQVDAMLPVLVEGEKIAGAPFPPPDPASTTTTAELCKQMKDRERAREALKPMNARQKAALEAMAKKAPQWGADLVTTPDADYGADPTVVAMIASLVAGLDEAKTARLRVWRNDGQTNGRPWETESPTVRSTSLVYAALMCVAHLHTSRAPEKLTRAALATVLQRPLERGWKTGAVFGSLTTEEADFLASLVANGHDDPTFIAELEKTVTA